MHGDTEDIDEVIHTLAGDNMPAKLHQCLIRVIPDASSVEYTTIHCDLKTPSLLQWQLNVCLHFAWSSALNHC